MQRIFMLVLAVLPLTALAQPTGWNTPFEDQLPTAPTVQISNLSALGRSELFFQRASVGMPLGLSGGAERGWGILADARFETTWVPSEARAGSSGGPVGVAIGHWRPRKRGDGYTSVRLRAHMPTNGVLLAGPYALYLNETLPNVEVIYDARRRGDTGELALQAAVGITGAHMAVWGTRDLGEDTALAAGGALGLLDPLHLTVGLRQRLGSQVELSVDGVFSATNPMIASESDAFGVAVGPAVALRWRGAVPE